MLLHVLRYDREGVQCEREGGREGGHRTAQHIITQIIPFPSVAAGQVETRAGEETIKEL